jgi:hypothetical protein
LRAIEHLIRRPGEEVHVLDLAGDTDTGDAGPAIDKEARDAYRRRARELGEEIKEAEAWSDRGRVEKLREELEQIGEELARSVGLGGRDRKAASSAERARVNVQKRIRDALRKLEERSPELARHLEWAIKTGTFCSYRGRRHDVPPAVTPKKRDGRDDQ